MSDVPDRAARDGAAAGGDPEVVTLEVVDRVAHVRLRRPEKRNAMSLAVFDQLHERAREIATSPEVGAVVVAGEGGVFSAGIDLEVLAGQAGDGLDPTFVARLQAAFTAYEDLEVPTIAAIEGYCFGAGAQLALACHLRAVADDVALSIMEARWGLVPDLGATWRLPRLVGPGRATELILTARRVGAEEALAIGMAELRPGGQVFLDEVHGFAARLAAGPGALRRVAGLVRANLGADRQEALAREAAVQAEVTRGPDVREAMVAHLEGRDPRFVGR